VTPDRTAAAIEARRRATEQKLHQVRVAIADLRCHKTATTYPAIAGRAAVSRTFLYENPAARALISDAITKAAGRRVQALAEADAEQEASWRERALNAEDALRAAHAEIRTQRARIGQLLGQLRHTERDLSQDAIQRITTENTTLKQRVRQLAQDNRTLEERLQAARNNGRFADRRIAQLETQLLEHANCCDRSE
jgi:outer membrane murein-binding lipoprotein Lpp